MTGTGAPSIIVHKQGTDKYFHIHRVFFTQLPGSQGLYQKLQLEQVAFITRPDNHVAAVTLLDEDGASSFDLYFSKIIPQPLRNT